MSDTGSDRCGSIRRILDHPLQSDEDYAELARLVEDDTDESVIFVDHDFDICDIVH